jgi:hypothetical protein
MRIVAHAEQRSVEFLAAAKHATAETPPDQPIALLRYFE